jgi:RHS repeat-associated protein
LFTSLLPSPCLGQSTATGTPPFGSYGGGPDVINLANLNVHWTIPVLYKPGRNTNFTYDLTYDTSVWYPVTSGSTKTWQPVLNFGWRGATEISFGYVSFNSYTWTCIEPDTGNKLSVTTHDTWAYHDAFGVAHSFPNAVLYGGQYLRCGLSNVTTDAADDGTGYQIVASLTSPSVTSPSGATFKPPVNNTTGAASYTDRNGNQITVNGSGQFFDTLSSTTPVLTVSGSGTATSPTTFTYTAPSSASANYTMKYSSYTLQTKFSCGGVSEYGPTSVNLVSEIDLPDGSKYTFTYEPTPGVPANVTGRIASVTLPTGGKISYTYTGGSNGINCTDGSASGLQRYTPDSGSNYWNYARTAGTGAAYTTTITDPQGNQTVMQFQGIYETQRQVYQGTTSGTLIQTVNTCYNGATSPCTGTALGLPITQRSETVQLDLSGLQGYTVSKYNGNGTLTEVDSYGYGSGAVGPLLKKTTYSYAPLGNNISAFRQAAKISDANNTVVSQTNSNYDETSVTPTSGVPQHVSVSGSRGNLTSVQTCIALPSCSSYITARATYDDTGQALSATDSNNNTTSFSYADSFYTDNGANPPQTYTPAASTNAYVTKVTAPIIGTSATYGYYFYLGQPAVSKDQNGADSYSHFDSIGRPATGYLPPRPDGNRAWTLSQYPSATEVDSYTSITSTSPSSSCASCRHQQENFDGSGRTTTDVLVNDPDGSATVATAYDSLGRVASTTNPYRSTSDPTYGVVTPTYDALGRVTKVTAADGSITYEYYGGGVTSAGGASSQLCSSSTYGYGYPVLIVDASGKKRQNWADGLGRIFEVDEPDQNGNMSIATCNSFDLLNNLTQVVQGSETRTYSYDALSRLTASTTPEAGTLNTYYATASGVLCSGNPAFICRKTDARGITTTYSYDALNRLTTATYSDGTAQVQYLYDQTSYNGLTITNGKGRLTGTSDASGTSAYSYDLLGQILAENHTISGVTKSISYSYNLDGSIASMTYPSGRVVSYAYSNAQRPLSVLDSVSGNYFAKAAVYAPPGAQASVLYGYTSTFSGITASYTYSNRLQLKNQTASSSNGVALNLNYGFPSAPGNNNRVTSIVNNVDNGRTQSASYDTLNRISSAQSQATSGADCWGQSYGYDRWANLLSVSVTQCSAGMLSVLTTNNRITNTGFSYDLAGNMTNDGINAYTYDAGNHLTSAAGVTYTYDARDLRVKKSSGTLYWRGFLGDALAESDLSGNIQNEYIFFGGQRTARVDWGGNAYYYFSDRLGSTRAITNSSGTVCYNADFTPFGSELAFTNVCSQNYKFTGYERDQETGLDYAVYRQYSGRLGRFLQPDPLGGHVTNPQSLNRYTYVLNDPLNWTDHLGLSPCPAGTHPATLQEAQAMAQAANSFIQAHTGIPWAPPPGITYANGQISSIDCSHMFNLVVNSVAGASVPYATAGQIYQGNASGITQIPDGSAPQVGDVISFSGHVGILSSTTPLTFRGSQSSTGPAQTKPQAASYWGNQSHKFFRICMQDKTAKPGSGGGGGGASAPSFSVVVWLVDLVSPIPPPPPPPPAPSTPPPTEVVTVSICVNGTCTPVAPADPGTQNSSGTDNGSTDNGANDGTGTDSSGNSSGDSGSGDAGGGGGGGSDTGAPIPFDGPPDETLVWPFNCYVGSANCDRDYVQMPRLGDARVRRRSERIAERSPIFAWRPRIAEGGNIGHRLLGAAKKTFPQERRQYPTFVKIAQAENNQSIMRNKLCYAFLRAGDLWTVCDGKRERIDLHGRGLDFAVTADGSYLAVQENLEAPGAGIGHTRQIVVPLNSRGKQNVREVGYPESLYASCGTIISVQSVNLESFDLLGSRPVEISPYRYFRCSSDRKAIAGWTEQDEAQRLAKARTDPGLSNQTTLRVNRNGKNSELSSVWREVFDISPNGEYLAYVNVPVKGPGPTLCVTERAAEPMCTLYVADAISVSNEGKVIFWAGDAGVMYWRPGQKRPIALEKAMTNPHAQWITPGVADALHAWASSAHASWRPQQDKGQILNVSARGSVKRAGSM